MDWLTIIKPLITDVIVPLAIPVGVTFASIYLKKRWGIEVSENQKKIAIQVIEAIEEKACAAKKAGAIMTGEQKRTEAIAEYSNITKAPENKAAVAIDLAVGSHPTIGACTVKIDPNTPAG